MDSESIQLNDFLSGTYSYYFNKSDNPYCYDEDGNYTLDYMIGNGVYNPEDFYYARLEYSSEWIQQPGHCRNWPILCASTKLIEEYNELRDELYGSIIDDIVLSGFIDPNVENLKVEMDSASDFLESYKQRRTTYLTNALENFRSQAKSLKETWDSLKTTFDIDLGMLQDTSQGFYMIQVEDGGWAKGRKDKEGVENIHDIYSGSWYHTTKEGKGDYSRVSFKEIDTSTFTTKLNSVMEIVDQFGDIFYGNTSKHSSYATTTAASVPIASSTRPAFESILNDYQKLQPQLDSIIRQVEDLFYNPAIMKNGSSTLTEYKSSSSSSM